MDQASPEEGSDNPADEVTRPLSMKEFLEGIHPSSTRQVADAWELQNHGFGPRRYVTVPDLRLHCDTCGGERTFRSGDKNFVSTKSPYANLSYQCGDCHKQSKLFSLWIGEVDSGDSGEAPVYKFGELPQYGVPLSNKVLRLFGRDADLFKKGRQCEVQGFGIAAFAYYRRVVENHKNDILDEIIKVCRTLKAPQNMISEIEGAKAEISFSKAVNSIQGGVPQGLLIDGHNPLLALHGALSIGLHEESDGDCLDAAQSVRLVLTELAERMASLRADNRQISEAVQKLIAKKK